MFGKLQEINARPAVFSHDTVADLWTDEHTSAQMLTYHLDGSVDLSSRKTTFIDRSAEWIVSRFGLDETKSVLDLGCGPGLYTTRLARSGAQVTGIDFSKRSIQYAQKQSQRQGLPIDHVHADYQQYETNARFDLITMIMCDFCVLSPRRVQKMLDKIFAFLKPGGAVLLDAYTLRAFEKREEIATYAPGLLDGFWSSEPYFGFLNTFKYEPDKVVCDKYTIIEKGATRVIYNWLQYYDPQALGKIFEGRGFAVEPLLGDVAGAVFDPLADEFAVVAMKPGSA